MIRIRLSQIIQFIKSFLNKTDKYYVINDKEKKIIMIYYGKNIDYNDVLEHQQLINNSLTYKRLLNTSIRELEKTYELVKELKDGLLKVQDRTNDVIIKKYINNLFERTDILNILDNRQIWK